MAKKIKHKKRKRQKKVRLPTDRYGNPVNVGDCLVFDDDVIVVTSLTLFSDGEWTAGTVENDFASDNISGGIVISLSEMKEVKKWNSKGSLQSD